MSREPALVAARPASARTARAPRVLALHLPDLPLQRLQRSRSPLDPGPRPFARSVPAAAGRGVEGGRGAQAQGERAEKALAVLDEGRVVCCDAEARAAGVQAGMTAAQALGALGRLELATLDAAGDRAALQALAEALLSLAPAVEVSPPDALLLDAGAAHVVTGLGAGAAGTERAERELAARALAIAAELGWSARAAVVTGRAPARAMACHGDAGGDGVIWVPPGTSPRSLGALPLGALGLAPAVVARLAEVGIRDAGGLTRLPEGTLAHRFGPEGVAAARLARGEDASPLVPFQPATLPEEALELEGPAESAEPLLFALKRLADRVAARLAGRGLGATRLRLVLRLDPRGEERIDAPLAQASASPARWLGPLKEHLFTLRLPGAVVGLRLLAVEVAPTAVEQLAFGDRPEAVTALEAVLARLSVRLGDEALFAAEPVARYRPERAYRAVPFSSGSRLGRSGRPGAPPEVPADASHRPTRLLPEPELVVAEGEGGRLTAVRVGGMDRAVLSFRGPERLAGEWWSERFDRDYYRVRLEGVGDCWIYRDGRDGRLWLHGFFD